MGKKKAGGKKAGGGKLTHNPRSSPPRMARG
jgi:hypothetical protein